VRINREGLVESARFVRSPNADARPQDVRIELIVIHNISLPPNEYGGSGIIELFTNTLDPNAHSYYQTIAGLRVSAHFLIRRSGELIQFVPCEERAWHAGESSWRGRERCNDFSIGIELEGSDDAAFEPIQYARGAELVRAIKRRYPIAATVGHSDIAPARKTDPGPFFDWSRFESLL
jgi:N-acetyl-anhydromuramoyl-L-alanine amidase